MDPDQAVLNQFCGLCALADGSKEGRDTLHAVIPSLYAGARSSSPCIPAILAVAWVTSAHFTTVNQRMDMARRKYGEAVVKLRDALQDPRTAKADDALCTVLLMLMLENMTATSQSMPDPMKHINGAVTLVNFRGMQNFESDAARTTFNFVKITLTALPAWHKTGGFAFSDEIVEADKRACARCESPGLSTRLGNIAFAIAVLRGKLDRAALDHSKPQSVCEVFQQSRILNQELMAWRLSVPKEWEVFSFVSPDNQKQSLDSAELARAPTWRGYTASYPDSWIARLLNHFRMHSIAIQAIDIRCADWIARYCSAERPASEVPIPGDVATAHDSLTRLKAQKVIRTLVDGICASVPYHLDELVLKVRQDESVGRGRSRKSCQKFRPGETGSAASNESQSRLRGPRGPGGSFVLLQPLVVAYAAPGIPADQKRWILGKALEIAKHIGMDEEMVEKMLNKLASS